MNVLLMLAHSIEEFDQVRLLSGLGHTVASLGGYIEPAAPHDDKRPGLPVPTVQFVKDAVDRLGQEGHADPLEAARRRLPDDVIDWADVIIVHHLEQRWLSPQWDRIKHKRVVWRTVGQSGDLNEAGMAPLHAQGLEIVRYSPRERHLPNFAGESALIRFYKDPDEWTGWNGHIGVVTNVTQAMLDRDPWTNVRYWLAATQGLPVRPMGDGSDRLGGTGKLSLERMRFGLQNARAYLYTGTQPASYTLGLLEAGMTGVPIVSIGPGWMRIFPWGSLLFEAHELVPLGGFEEPAEAADQLRALLADEGWAREISARQRAAFVAEFGLDTVAEQWERFLTGRQATFHDPLRQAQEVAA